MSEGELPTFAAPDWKSVLLEPPLIAACLFWFAILPLTGLFCASVALSDKVASLKKATLRMPDLRSRGTHNPLVLRKKNLPGQTIAAQTGNIARAFQS